MEMATCDIDTTGVTKFDKSEQLLRYSEDELVAEARAKGELKLITIVWRSWELALLEEVTLS
jgi:hypothetical protein